MILVIDDDNFGMKPFLLALRAAGFDVDSALNPDDALRVLDSATDLECVILDVLMPTGQIFEDADTNHGEETGYLLLELVRNRLPQIPIIVLSITNADQVKPDARTKIVHKQNTLPSELVREVKALLRLEG